MNTYIVRKSSFFIDILIVVFFAAVIYSVILLVVRYQAPLQSTFSMDISPKSLPYYAILSTERMAIAYIISLVFSLIYARLTILNKITESTLLPILDVLQSIPILSFMPGVVLALVALFPHSNIGLELAAIILIFTSQAWNITFGYYQALITIPTELKEVSAINHLGLWQKFTRLELPAGAIPLVWNSMMSWAGGWFFLMASEQFTLGDKSFQIPGLGSYMQAAANAGNVPALMWGLGTLLFVIVFLDQVLWRPIVAWSDKFKLEQDSSNEQYKSWVLSLLKQSGLILMLSKIVFRPISVFIDRVMSRATRIRKIMRTPQRGEEHILKAVGILSVFLLFTLLLWGIYRITGLIKMLTTSEWKELFRGAGATIFRTTAALVIAALWTVPLGVAVGLSPRWSKKIQPLVQMAASVPATALFPALLLLLLKLPQGLNIAAIILMLLGTQWYVLFNVIAGAMAIPNDLREATTIYKLKGFKKWRYMILPSIFPYLVTGMLTATGGAWNASIVSEYVMFSGKVHETTGLGATISEAANNSNFPLLLAATILMALIVFVINRLFWQRLYRLAEKKYHFE